MAQGRFNMPLNEIKASEDIPELAAVRFLALFNTSSTPEAKNDAVSGAMGLVSAGVSSPLLGIVVGSLFYAAELVDDALRVVSPFPKNLEW
jgi:hypothetical protein